MVFFPPSPRDERRGMSELLPWLLLSHKCGMAQLLSKFVTPSTPENHLYMRVRRNIAGGRGGEVGLDRQRLISQRPNRKARRGGPGAGESRQEGRLGGLADQKGEAEVAVQKNRHKTRVCSAFSPRVPPRVKELGQSPSGVAW